MRAHSLLLSRRCRIGLARGMSTSPSSSVEVSLSRALSRLEAYRSRVLYVDDAIIVFDKEAGMPSVPTRETTVVVQGKGVTTASGVEMPRKRSAQWGDAVRNASLNSKENSVKRIFESLKDPLEALPRREGSFKQHVGRVAKVGANSDVLAQVWEDVVLEDTKLRYPQGFIDGVPDDSLSAAAVVSELVGKQIYVVHRLDMDTSGIIMFAKDSSACNTLNEQFRLKTIDKKYLAEVHGQWDDTICSIDLKIRPDLDNRPSQVVDPIDGKQCETSVNVLAYKKETTILELRPVTGRTHQLRVHTSALGHPILGDTLYASDMIRDLSPDGLRLHAQEIAFNHPVTGERIKLESISCPFE